MMTASAKRNRASSLAFVAGTSMQAAIAKHLLGRRRPFGPLDFITVSLENFYQFGIDIEVCGPVFSIKSLFSKPWYDRHPAFKLISLPHYLWQIWLLSRKFGYFVFFVDTGILERSAILFLNTVGCCTIVVQDALKLPMREKNKKSLLGFGNGKADYYLLIGKRFIPLIENGRSVVTGSPLINNRLQGLPPGKKILIINQCAARYGFTTENEEYRLIEQVVKEAAPYGMIELRLHPHNNAKRYETLRSNHVNVTINKPLAESLQDAGIVLCTCSTIILDAMAAGRSVLIMDWFPSHYQNTIKAGVKPCGTIEDLRVALEAWRGGHPVCSASMGQVERELREFVTYSGQESVERITTAILKIVREHERE